MADQEIEYLNNEFQDYLHKIESRNFIASYSFREKFIFTNWLTKLKKSNGTVEELRLRNRFIKHFNSNQETEVNVFRSDPFKNIPDDFGGPLVGLKKLLPKDSSDALNPTEDDQRSYIAELFRSLPDKGEFLAKQPVPRDGSFFIHVFRPNDPAVCPKP